MIKVARVANCEHCSNVGAGKPLLCDRCGVEVTDRVHGLFHFRYSVAGIGGYLHLCASCNEQIQPDRLVSPQQK